MQSNVQHRFVYHSCKFHDSRGVSSDLLGTARIVPFPILFLFSYQLMVIYLPGDDGVIVQVHARAKGLEVGSVHPLNMVANLAVEVQ
jgi:hypothetical protein